MGAGVTRGLPVRAMGIAVFLVLSLAIAAPAAAGKSTLRLASNPIGILNVYFSPTGLPKTKPTPIRFTVTARIDAGAEHPPPLKELLLRLDRHVSLDLKDVPTTQDVGCSSGSGPHLDVGKVRKACGAAVVGSGRMGVEVQFPDRAPISVESRLLALNGGVEGRRATLYLYSHFSAPVTGAVVTTMEIEKIRRGSYGLEAAAAFPKIAGGSGSITSFALSLKRGVLAATCPTGRLHFRGVPVFAEDSDPGESIVRTCASKPEARG